MEERSSTINTINNVPCRKLKLNDEAQTTAKVISHNKSSRAVLQTEQKACIPHVRINSASSSAQLSTANKRSAWKYSTIVAVCVALLVPILTWTGLIAAGSQWIDKAKLDMFYEQVQQQVALPNGQPLVRPDEMPSYIGAALLAIEDHRFYLHPGVDPVGMVRSLWVDVIKQSKVQGGSTITMQLSRNLFLSHEKKFVRKFKEVAIALNLDWNYSKQDLLGMYLNKVYFGHGKYGIEAAANYYFAKTTRSLNNVPTIDLAESALLVGLLKAPEHYSPFKNLQRAQQRQQVVLYRMYDLGWITKNELQTALHKPVILAKR
ncbi:biosynthetic peptidoglycan transglycosylase [Paenibacillus taiwanensis]|uniref:biosynthetic peptidoglycan transglycosylase n=1 Tax=Paenibacillus taiwanensis TaxID=401638 RepID=UPI00041163DB|nr:biosynthetic peptidoglycan transglycosylase [Paenibacillus taiwanensis]